MNRRRNGTVFFCLVLPLLCSAQTKDPQALAALNKSAAALGVAVPSASFQAIVSYNSGSDQESFPATFTASSFANTVVTFQRSTGSVIETRHKGNGSWTGVDGRTHQIALHNTWTSAAWFSPALLIAEWSSDPELVISDVGPEQRNGSAVEHLHAYRKPAWRMDEGTAALIAAASRMDLFVDAATGTPVALEFDAHSDTSETVDIPVRIEFEDYRNGQPYHIRKYFNGTLLLDIKVSEVSGGAQ